MIVPIEIELFTTHEKQVHQLGVQVGPWRHFGRCRSNLPETMVSWGNSGSSQLTGIVGAPIAGHPKDPPWRIYGYHCYKIVSSQGRMRKQRGPTAPGRAVFPCCTFSSRATIRGLVTPACLG